MIFLQTNAADLNALLIALRDFLSGNGWTITTDGTGAGGLVLTVENANGQTFYLTSTTTAQVDAVTGAFNDVRLQCTFEKGDIGLAAGASATKTTTNDMAGPFANVWLITDDDATYCHIIAQSAASRYAHMSFGTLDPKGLHAVDLPFAVGTYYQWWHTSTLPNDSGCNQNDPSDTNHQIGLFCENTTITRVGIPDALLDPTLFFDDGALEVPSYRRTCSRGYTYVFSSSSAQRLLDYPRYMINHTYTGGVNIAPLPVSIAGTSDNLHAFVGMFPGVGLVSMLSLSPGQVLSFSGEEWICFPLKQQGNVVNCNSGGLGTIDCNSAFYGFAYKKTDAP